MISFPIVYARSTTGKVSQWQIEVEGNKFRTISGFTDGLKTTSSWTECFAKNVKKSNATTNEQQALAQATSKHKNKLALGYFEDINDIDNPIHFEPMLAKDWADVKNKLKYPVIDERKYDGVRSINRSTGMWTRNGKPQISAPHIFDSIKHLWDEIPDLILDGELYCDREDGDFNKIISLCRKSKPTKEDLIESAAKVKYYIYDMPSHDGELVERKKALRKLFNRGMPACCVFVESKISHNETEVLEHAQQYLEEGYEGLMVRTMDGLYESGKRSKNLIKYKEWITDEYEILGVVEGKGKLAGKVGKLQFEHNGNLFESAVNGDHEYLAELFEAGNLIGKMATVKYFMLTTTSKPVPKFQKVIAIRDYE